MITISDNAGRALLDLIAEKGADKGLRLAVEKGGCAGLQYAITIDAAKAGDLIAEHLGARVFIDPDSASYLDECTLDFEGGLTGAGFRIHNPRAVRSCGCGTSFEPTTHSH